MENTNTTENQGVEAVEGQKVAAPKELTFGEKAVGMTFNPTNNMDVHNCKETFAAIIDQLNNRRLVAGPGEAGRLYSVAITEAQTAQMWAVKALTWKN